MRSPTPAPSLSDRLHGYSRSTGVTGVAAAVTGAGLSWTVLMPQSAEAVINTYSIPNGAFGRFGTDLPGLASGSAAFGPDGSRWIIGGNNGRIRAFGPGLDYWGGSVAQSGTINTTMNFPTATSISPTGQTFPFWRGLRLTVGGDHYFGWIEGLFPGAGYRIGFSDVPNAGVLAGTTTELAAAVPEPGTALPLLLLGAAGLAAHRRRQRACNEHQDSDRDAHTV